MRRPDGSPGPQAPALSEALDAWWRLCWRRYRMGDHHHTAHTYRDLALVREQRGDDYVRSEVARVHGPCVNPDAMHGACDGFGGSDY